jgi:hypothetical protein
MFLYEREEDVQKRVRQTLKKKRVEHLEGDLIRALRKLYFVKENELRK